MNTEDLAQMIEEAVSKALPKRWLTREDLMTEFNIGKTVLQEILKDPYDALPYSSMGAKKQLFDREDVNAYLTRRKRNG